MRASQGNQFLCELPQAATNRAAESNTNLSCSVLPSRMEMSAGPRSLTTVGDSPSLLRPASGGWLAGLAVPRFVAVSLQSLPSWSQGLSLFPSHKAMF